jgi:thioester reductase-like protein
MDKGERRLKRLLFYYYGKNYKELFGSRLHVVLGDVTEKISLDAHIDTVYNCAAIVKHYSSGTEIEDVNIGGAVNCTLFCQETGARLIHVSTYSTAGLSVNGQPAPDILQTEQKLYYGQYMDNRYVHSKFVAERTVLEAVALHGLNAKVMRVGNLAPRSTDGEFQINAQTNSAMGRVKVFKTLGCYPYDMTDQPMEFSPINEVAHAIVILSETPRECCLFHPFNNHYVHFGDVLQELRLIGDAPRQVETAEYEDALDKAKNDPVKAQQLQSLLAYQDLAHGQQAVAIRTVNDYTTQVLYRLGFSWSPTSWDYVERMLTAIGGFGFFE